MRTLKSLAAAAVLAASLLAAAAAPASADVQGGDKFRVRGLASNQVLNLMNGPARWAGVEVQIPFNANDIRATGVRQAGWLQVSYRVNGYDYTGWVEQQYLVPDEQVEPAAYRIVNLRRGESVPLMDINGNGVLAYIPAGVSVVPVGPPCENGYCQVRYQCRRGTYEGLVDQSYLAVIQPVYSQLPDASQGNPGYATADVTYSSGYADVPQQNANDFTDILGALPLDRPAYRAPQHRWHPHGHHERY